MSHPGKAADKKNTIFIYKLHKNFHFPNSCCFSKIKNIYINFVANNNKKHKFAPSKSHNNNLSSWDLSRMTHILNVLQLSLSLLHKQHHLPSSDINHTGRQSSSHFRRRMRSCLRRFGGRNSDWVASPGRYAVSGGCYLPNLLKAGLFNYRKQE